MRTTASFADCDTLRLLYMFVRIVTFKIMDSRDGVSGKTPCKLALNVQDSVRPESIILCAMSAHFKGLRLRVFDTKACRWVGCLLGPRICILRASPCNSDTYLRLDS